MNSKKIILSLFIVVAILQLLVPAKMIFEREDILNSGKEFHFKTAPIDPNDIFRGKYVALNFKENSIEVPIGNHWEYNETVYVEIKKDMDGFAAIETVSKLEPPADADYIKAKVSFVSTDKSNEIGIKYPFDKFYLEESKAPEAETAYRKSQLDTSQVTYAIVKIKAGESVLKDVIIGKVSIRNLDKNKK